MPGNTINLNLPYPLGNETADPAKDIENLAKALDSTVETTTGAQAKANAAQANAEGYTDIKLAALIAAAPGALDTLKELADALGDDPNFATTITNLISAKADATTVNEHLAESATETQVGHVQLATAVETTTGTNNTKAVHPAGLKVELDKKANLSGGTMTGVLTAQNNTFYTTKQVRNVTLSTSAPSGGGNGDVWFVYV